MSPDHWALLLAPGGALPQDGLIDLRDVLMAQVRDQVQADGILVPPALPAFKRLCLGGHFERHRREGALRRPGAREALGLGPSPYRSVQSHAAAHALLCPAY
jgi:hypothetical protein